MIQYKRSVCYVGGLAKSARLRGKGDGLDETGDSSDFDSGSPIADLFVYSNRRQWLSPCPAGK